MPTSSEKQAGTPLVEIINISKRFGTKTALEDAGLSLYQGEILGLVGDNGAGKSTLLKILSGAVQRSGGRIQVCGESCTKMTPRLSRSLGIEMVFQDLALCEKMTVWENIYLGRYRHLRLGIFSLPFLDKSAMRREAARCLEDVGMEDLDVDQPACDLSGGQRQAVAICRAMLFHPQIILLDEPTASLAVKEQKRISTLIREIRSRGVSIIMISHDISQIVEVSDRVTVLKEGVTIWCGNTSGTSPEDLVQKMFVGSTNDHQCDDSPPATPAE